MPAHRHYWITGIYICILTLVISLCINVQSFENYKVQFHLNFCNFIDSFEQDLQEHNLTRVIAGYAWEWKTQPRRNPSVDTFDIEIEGMKLKWNRTYNNWIRLGLEDSEVAHEVGCIHSIQGYDLSNAYVIVGEDLQLDVETNTLQASKDNYFDRNGFATVTMVGCPAVTYFGRQCFK